MKVEKKKSNNTKQVIHQCKLHLSAIFIYLFVYYDYQPGRSFYLVKTFSKFLSRFEGLRGFFIYIFYFVRSIYASRVEWSE